MAPDWLGSPQHLIAGALLTRVLLRALRPRIAVPWLAKRVGHGGTCEVGPVPRSQCTTYIYDDAGQLNSIDYSEATARAWSMTYDALGRRISMRDATGSSTRAYDSLGRLTSTKDGYNSTVGYEYDLGDNLTAITYPGSLKVTRNYDAVGRMDWLQDWRSNKTTFGYDANSNLGQPRVGASVAALGNGMKDGETRYLRLGTGSMDSLPVTWDDTRSKWVSTPQVLAAVHKNTATTSTTYERVPSSESIRHTVIALKSLYDAGMRPEVYVESYMQAAGGGRVLVQGGIAEIANGGTASTVIATGGRFRRARRVRTAS